MPHQSDARWPDGDKMLSGIDYFGESMLAARFLQWHMCHAEKAPFSLVLVQVIGGASADLADVVLLKNCVSL